MKKLERTFREAARMVAENEVVNKRGTVENWSCLAVKDAAGSKDFYAEVPEVRKYAEIFDTEPMYMLDLITQVGPDERDHVRVLALLFAAQVVATGDV